MSKEIEKIIKKVQGDDDKKNERRFDGMMEVLEEKFEIIQEQFSGVHKKLDSHSDQIANILVDLSDVKLNMRKVSYDVAMDLDRKINKKHFVDLEGRVRVLERHKK